MRQTLPLSFDVVLHAEADKFLSGVLAHKGGRLVHVATGIDVGAEEEEAGFLLLAVSGFTDLELGLPEDHGHGRWTYAQYAMAHALTKTGWTRKQTAAAIGKSRNAVIGLLYRETPWRTVADTRAGDWSAEDTAAVIHLREVDKWKWRDIAEAVGWSECYCRLRYRETKNPKPEEPHCARV